MVILTTPLLTAIAVLSAVTSAAPSQRLKRDSSINEPAFSAPNGVIESAAAAPSPVSAGSSYGPNSYGSSSSNNWNSGNYNSDSSNNNWNQASSNNNYGSNNNNNYGSSSNNWDQGSNNNNNNNWNQGPSSNNNNWNQGSNNWDSSSSDTWSSTSSADNSWQTPANNSWQSPADDSAQSTSTTTWVATSTVEAASATQTWSSSDNSGNSWGDSSNSYGSGSSNWGSDYNNCVSQCQAQWGLPPPSTTAPPSYGGSGSSGSWNGGSGSGSAVTHTVVVAPTQGVLRYIPFSINASVGDTISWQWHAGPHTVTKSSESLPCNKTMDNPFASGSQNASFVFNQLINDTDPVFYYCGVPGHCAKGMFGIVNAPSTIDVSTNLESQILAQAANNPTMSAMVAMVNNMTMGTSAYNWGASMDMSSVPPENQQSFIENVMYTRLFYAANNGSLESGLGAYSPSGALVWPTDLSTLMASANVGAGTPDNTSSSAAPGASPSSGASSNAYGSMSTSGANHRMAYSGGFLAVAAIVAGAFLA
ncbi:hypothetical protein DACRYDRAFT_20127 [Dacryopinax primogenitus]|uniref:Phytocyanin domain-containing protein n=1 Tax=Dacryopinax primogenitus (strain DJM 731) TaxID=1858805 RepID=M5GBG9_DACPD|nr:uncharacterized protein DACRYDRAFT_20127 [Dacryopinax primogenitus]EJU05735.1 hypothetical protein DACRYDRAFT_20127 [Dacryopinax primogenitus]